MLEKNPQNKKNEIISNLYYQTPPNIVYSNDSNRLNAALNIVSNAILFYKDTWLISNFNNYKKIVIDNLTRCMEYSSQESKTSDIIKHWEFRDECGFNKEFFYDSIKLSFSFELYALSALLTDGYIVHRIKDTRYKQKMVPCSKFNDLNSKIQDNTIPFNWLLSGDYCDYLLNKGIKMSVLSFFKEKNSLRNTAHFLEHRISTHGPNFGRLEEVNSFVNNEVIELYHNLLKKLGNNKNFFPNKIQLDFNLPSIPLSSHTELAI